MKKHFLILGFSAALLASAHAASVDSIRLTPAEIAVKAAQGAGAGTSGVAGIQTTVLLGDPAKPGLYTIRLSIPANTSIQAHTHRDDRAAMVVSGTWYFGYGNVAQEAATRALGPGSFYTEPGGVAHFAMTKAQPVVVNITGYGPTDTIYVNAKGTPKPAK